MRKKLLNLNLSDELVPYLHTCRELLPWADGPSAFKVSLSLIIVFQGCGCVDEENMLV